MPALRPLPRFEPIPAPPQGISPAETARYTSDLLENLRKMAVGQGQDILAHLLELARFEAKSLAKAEAEKEPEA